MSNMFGNKSKSKSSSKSSSAPQQPKPRAALDEGLRDIISMKDPERWDINETAAWLAMEELGELSDIFADNSVAGSELLDLTEEDMKSMGINKLGHRKKLLKLIAKLRGDTTSSASLAANSQTTASNQAESSDATSEEVVKGKLNVKCQFRGEWYSIKFTKSTTFKSLRRQLEDQFECRLRIKYSDSDGDMVTIKRESDLQECIREASVRGSTRVKLYLTERSESSSSTTSHGSSDKSHVARADMFSMFEFILDPVIIINEGGIVQFINKKVEATLGYSSGDMVGRNVNMIMTEDIKPYHDNFLRNYLKTGVSRIIGKGRDVIAVKKDGSIIPIHLEVSEKSVGSGKLFYIGILKEAKAQTQEKSLLQQEREVLDTLIVPAIIIDQFGMIHGFNKTAQDFLGYSLVDVIGKNVNMFMPSPHKEAHDGYLKAYMETGKGKIIGVGRRVVAQHKDGTLLPIFLTVTEKRDKDKRFFTGILQEVQTAVATPSKSSSSNVEKK